MARRVSIHELKRRLMREMARQGGYISERVARDVRAHACAVAFAGGRSIANIAADTDLAAGWDESTTESEIRGRLTLKGRR